MTEPKFITLEMNHLGPFKDRVKLKEEKIGPLCTTIYARNGSGKSFIGRAFSQIEHFQQGEKCEYIEKLLSFGTNDMDFSFACYKKEENNPADLNKFSFSYNQIFKETIFDIHSKISRQVKKEKNTTSNEKKYQSIERDIEMTQMIDLQKKPLKPLL